MGEKARGIWGELRRRRVVSTAAAYLAVAFVVLQLGEILFPAFDLGPAALRGLFALLFAAFPIVLALSWVYDVTSRGLTRTDDGTQRGPSAAILAGVLASALALGGAGWWAVRTVDPGAAFAASERSIAVLPFADFSPDGDQSYLGDGVAEEILNLLAGIEDLQVAARTSSFAFRENDDIRDIANQLDVAYVLEGSVRSSGDAVRVTAQLISAGDGFHVWSDTYDRQLDDLFAVQDEIAGAITEALLGELELGSFADRGHVASAEAQQLYYRGRAQWSRRGAVGIPEAIELFNRAIEVDSLYAAAYAGLADSWALMPQFVQTVDPVDAMMRAEAAALEAIRLDDNLAEAHASLGLVRALRQDRPGALASLGRAIELNGSYAPALHWRANVLTDMGRLIEATADIERAAAVDPLSPAIATDYGNVLLWIGDVGAAREQYAHAQSLDFGYAPAVLGMALAALESDEIVELNMNLTQWGTLVGLPPTLGARLATAMISYRTTGMAGTAPVELTTTAAQIPSGTRALLFALIGAGDEALAALEGAVQDGSWIDQYLRVNPAYDGLRGTDAFDDILLQVGA